jgi:hypothetical protein
VPRRAGRVRGGDGARGGSHPDRQRTRSCRHPHPLLPEPWASPSFAEA